MTSIFCEFLAFCDVFGLFFTCKYNKQKSLNYINFNKTFLCNIQSIESWYLRGQDETWNLQDRDWDLQKWVSRQDFKPSRPRPSLETPSLPKTPSITGTIQPWSKHDFMYYTCHVTTSTKCSTEGKLAPAELFPQETKKTLPKQLYNLITRIKQKQINL